MYKRQKSATNISKVWDVVAQWLVRRTWDQKVENSSPRRCTHVVFLGKTLNFHSASLHPGASCWKHG